MTMRMIIPMLLYLGISNSSAFLPVGRPSSSFSSSSAATSLAFSSIGQGTTTTTTTTTTRTTTTTTTTWATTTRHGPNLAFHRDHKERGRSRRRLLLRLEAAKVISDELPSSSSDQSSQVVDDVIVIGSGLAGLCCAALLSYCGIKTIVLESHDVYGGAAHSWERRGFHFESGPSLYSGLSSSNEDDGSPNPLKNIFQILEEDCEWITYDRWGTVLPNGDKFAAQIGPTEEFRNALRKFGGNGEEAVLEFQALVERMTPLSDAARALPSLALREDFGAIVTLLSRYPRELWDAIQVGKALNEPFGNILDEMQLQNKFVRNWLDMLCFLLQGLPAAGTMNAVMGYMLADWYRPGVTLDYPKGGSGAICNTLVRAIRRYGGKVCLNAHVEEIIVENNRACGVRFRSSGKNGVTTIRASQAVVSNADPYVTKRLLSNATLSNAMRTYMHQLTETDPTMGGIPDLKSFIHLHAGIDAAGLPTSAGADFPAQWAVITDWDMEGGVEAPRNIVLCSMPSLIDPSLAPPGKHVIHAYVPATEPYEWWTGMDRSSDAYRQKKEEAADFLWRAVEHYVPKARDRAVPGTVQIGTPLTHERFLRRTRGTYGYVYLYSCRLSTCPCCYDDVGDGDLLGKLCGQLTFFWLRISHHKHFLTHSTNK